MQIEPHASRFDSIEKLCNVVMSPWSQVSIIQVCTIHITNKNYHHHKQMKQTLQICNQSIDIKREREREMNALRCQSISIIYMNWISSFIIIRWYFNGRGRVCMCAHIDTSVMFYFRNVLHFGLDLCAAH